MPFNHSGPSRGSNTVFSGSRVLLSLILLAFVTFSACDSETADNADKGSRASTGTDAGDGATPGIAGGMMNAIPGQFNRIFEQVTKEVGGVTDVATAEDARDEIEKFTSRIDRFPGMDRLPDAAKKAIGESISKFSGDVPDLVEKVYEIPGVQDVLKPAVDGLLEKLKGFGG